MRRLELGDEGYDVGILQAILRYATQEDLPASQVFDQRTKMVLMIFQRFQNVDDAQIGVCDVRTWMLLLGFDREDEDAVPV